MSWGGVDAIPLPPTESRREAVDRVYAGGEVITFENDGVSISRLPGKERDFTVVSTRQRGRRIDAIRVMQDLRPGWAIVEELKADGRRWPWSLQLEQLEGSMWVQLTTESITFRLLKGAAVDNAEWSFWCRTIRRFAAWPAAT